jgi:hypothetical protein
MAAAGEFVRVMSKRVELCQAMGEKPEKRCGRLILRQAVTDVFQNTVKLKLFPMFF